MKTIYIIKGTEEFTYFMLLKNAEAHSLIVEIDFDKEEITEECFFELIEEGKIEDIEEFWETEKEQREIDNIKPAYNQLPAHTEQPQTESEKVQKQIADLMAMVEELKSANQQKETEIENLKKATNRRVLSLDDAVKLHDKKQELSKNKNIFDNAFDKITKTLISLDKVNKFNELSNFKLAVVELKHGNGKSQPTEEIVFSIANNFVISKVLEEVNSLINVEVNEIDNKIKEIESLYL